MHVQAIAALQRNSESLKPCPPCLARPTVVGAVCQRCHVAVETSSSAPVVTVDGKGLTNDTLIRS